ncbi:putative lipid II flippase FtsW [Patescibacteria group bacterium]|nr:putative lipid II flippase FtsW [Patescibacteria group bacterium]MBU4162168.1 putative lipid II flippase FtsW [Patescibacteria group bacterium]
MKKQKNKPDLILSLTISLLLILGFAILASVSLTVSQKVYGNSFQYLMHQIKYGYFPGLILGFLAYKINLKSLRKISLPALFGVIILMMLVFVPKIGVPIGGANRWVSLGPITIQPSELLKLIFIVYLAAWLTKHKEQNKKRVQLFLPFIIILTVVCVLLIKQPDISTLATIAAITLVMYFSAETPFWQTGLLILSGIGALAILIKTAPYRLNRLLVFLRPDAQPLGIGYQMKQALIAIGSGSIIGQGLGLSVQKSGFLPAPMTDSIFAVFAEETGFIGAIILISLFLIFAWQGFKIAKQSSEIFFKLIAIGITFWITLQAFINIGAMIGILPLTGIPLPLVSYGSSHLVMELIAIGLLLNISKQPKNNF